MSGQGIPGLKVQQDSGPSPLESQPVSTMAGWWNNYNANLMGTLGVSLEARGIGALEGGPPIPHDEAVRLMKDQNYDPKVLPDGPISAGLLDAISNQQSAIARSRNIAERSGIGGVAQTITGFAGGGSDPLFLFGGAASGPAAAELRAAIGGGRLVGAAVGATEGAAVLGEYTTAQKFAGTAQGDRDISTADIAKQMAFGGLLGGGAGAVFHSPVTTSEISKLERSAEAAKVQGVPINEVRSSAGAVGEHQITPATAAAYDIPASALTDPATNKKVSEFLLTELGKRYPNDPEAVSVAYNAGPKWANKWLAAGRDDAVLPKETQDYVARFREMRGLARVADGQIKMPQEAVKEAMADTFGKFLNDRQIDTKPAIEASLARQFSTSPLKIAMDHASEVRDITQEARDPVQSPKGMFDGDPDIAQVARLIDLQPLKETGPVPAVLELPAGAGAPETAGPETKAIQPFAEEARQAAEKLSKAVDPQGDPVFAEIAARHSEEETEAAVQDKAVETAVRCGVINGL